MGTVAGYHLHYGCPEISKLTLYPKNMMDGLLEIGLNLSYLRRNNGSTYLISNIRSQNIVKKLRSFHHDDLCHSIIINLFMKLYEIFKILAHEIAKFGCDY